MQARWTCSHNGNPLHSIANVTVDAAQNVFVVGQVSRNVFKLTPSGTVSEVADLSQDTRFDKHWFVASSIDSSGRLYFTATNQIDNATGALFRYSPLPIEKQEAFTIDPPHAAVIHDESGLAHFPTEYARTDYQHTGDVPAIANTLNTRSLPFADLPWDEAQRSTESVSSVDTVFETEISTLQVEGHTVRREELSEAEVPLGERYVRRLTYFVDGVETLKLFNLYFPRSEY